MDANDKNEKTSIQTASLLDVLLAFLKIGGTAFGGSTQALVYREVVENRRWLSEEQFLAGQAIAQVLPGANLVNMATMVGDRFQGAIGALLALIGLTFMPIVILVALAEFYDHFANMPDVVAGTRAAAAGAVGIGAVDDGDAFLSLGTSAQLFVATASYRPCPQKFLHAYCHAVPDRWFQMAAMLNGAVCLAWIAQQLGEGDIQLLLDRTEATAPRPSGLVFLPYLSGERTPHNDPQARGAFIGLDQATTPYSMVRAVLEGVAFSCVDARDCLSGAGTELSALSVIGGGSQSTFWMTIIASALNMPLIRHHGGEKGPAFGAARLARLAITQEPVAQVCSKPPIRDMLAPDSELAGLYAERLPRFRDLYARLKGAF
jgi:xylulokinase